MHHRCRSNSDGHQYPYQYSKLASCLSIPHAPSHQTAPKRDEMTLDANRAVYRQAKPLDSNSDLPVNFQKFQFSVHHLMHDCMTRLTNHNIMKQKMVQTSPKFSNKVQHCYTQTLKSLQNSKVLATRIPQ